MKFAASLLLAVMVAASAYGGCDPDMCLGPCNYEELLVDTGFTYNCPNWVWSSTHRQQVGTGWQAELRSLGWVKQTVSTGSYSHPMEVMFTAYSIASNPGTERLVVEIVRGSTVLETPAVIYPPSTPTDYRLTIGNYSNESALTVRFRYASGVAKGDGIFRVDNAVLFGTF